MRTAGELRAEADHLRTLARNVTDEPVLAKIRELIDELQARARDEETDT